MHSDDQRSEASRTPLSGDLLEPDGQYPRGLGVFIKLLLLTVRVVQVLTRVETVLGILGLAAAAFLLAR